MPSKQLLEAREKHLVKLLAPPSAHPSVPQWTQMLALQLALLLVRLWEMLEEQLSEPR